MALALLKQQLYCLLHPVSHAIESVLIARSLFFGLNFVNILITFTLLPSSKKVHALELKGADLLQVRQGECLIDTNIEFQIM